VTATPAGAAATPGFGVAGQLDLAGRVSSGNCPDILCGKFETRKKVAVRSLQHFPDVDRTPQ
jgi:hypothetical protein